MIANDARTPNAVASHQRACLANRPNKSTAQNMSSEIGTSVMTMPVRARVIGRAMSADAMARPTTPPAAAPTTR
jgi:hypothetical protein